MTGNRTATVNGTTEADRYAGRRYVTLIRQSDNTDGEQSIEAQQLYLDGYASSRRMLPATDGRVVLPGVTGSQPGNRTDLEALMKRKREKDDYDVLLVQKIDRMTRGGSGHGFWAEWEFQKLGVEIVYPGDNLPEGPYQGIIKMLKFEAARDQASSNGQRGSQGQQLALEQDRMAPFSHTPFGCWRLYLSEDYRPLYIIRNIGDGRQEKLDANTLKVIDTLGQIGGGQKGHFKKQKHERVFGIPGCPRQQDAVRHMLRWRWIDGLGGVRIAGRLNEMGVLSPQGKKWNQRMAESITENPIYLGRSVANVTSAAMFYMRNAGAPIPVNHDAQVMATADRPPKVHRPKEDWFWRDEKFLADFLDEELRTAMENKLMPTLLERSHRRLNGIDLQKGRRTRTDTPYLLSDLLTAVQDTSDAPVAMVGHLSGPTQGPHVRYYRHKQGKRRCEKDSPFNRLIPAEPLEAELVRVLRMVLAEVPDLRSVLVQRLSTALGETRAVEPADVEELRAQREAVRKRRQALARTFDEATMADILPVLAELVEEASRLDRQIAQSEAKLRALPLDPEQIANEMIAWINRTAGNLETLTSYQLKALVSALVAEAKADLVSKEVSLTFVLPDWAKMVESGLCPAPSSRSSTGHQTQSHLEMKAPAWPTLGVILAHYTCQYLHTRGSNRPVCYRCRRTSGAVVSGL